MNDKNLNEEKSVKNDELIAYRKKYYEMNKDKMKANASKYYRDNTEHCRRRITERMRTKFGALPMNVNKDCAVYLGVYISERILADVFTDVIRMPYGNKGYDFICGRGKKIDVKSTVSTFRGNSMSWGFHIARNTTADYFLCISYDDRNTLNPMYLWLIPGDDVSHLVQLRITSGKMDKWDKYMLKIDDVISTCNNLRIEDE